MTTNDLRSRLHAMGLQLPPAAAAATASYEPCRDASGLLSFSGVVSLDGDRVVTGRLGDSLTTQQGRDAARLCALGVLARLDAALRGDLGRLVQLWRVGVFVAATPDFTEHSRVADGASELFIEALGDPGRHARSAVGVASLPRGAAVEVEAVIEIRVPPER